MIGRVYRGSRVGGLLRYLFGPGRHNEHIDPHLVGCWDGEPQRIEPRVLAGGGHDVRTLVALLEQPVACCDRPLEQPVWHCALRVAPDDRRLTDDEWARVVDRVMDETGIAPSGDDEACRWVAVRHAEDHIHLVATLARQDGRPARLWRDFPKLRAACLAMERELGLTATAPADGAVPPRPTRAEVEKAARRARGHETSARGTGTGTVAPPRARARNSGGGGKRPRTARELLRMHVRRHAAAATDAEDFLGRLRMAGIVVKERRGEAGELTGYAVAMPGDVNAAGMPIFFSGGRLANDLTLPKLARAWNERDGISASHVGAHDTGAVARASEADEPRPGFDAQRVLAEAATRAQALREAADAAEFAARVIRRGDPADQAATARAVAAPLSVAAAVVPGRAGAYLAAAADTYERAAQTPRGSRPAALCGGSLASGRLAAAAMTMARAGATDDAADGAAIVAVIQALGLLVEAVAVWHAQARRDAQAAAARAAAEQLRQSARHVRASSLDTIAERVRVQAASHLVAGERQANEAMTRADRRSGATNGVINIVSTDQERPSVRGLT